MKTSGSGRHGICGTFALGRVSRASPVQTAMRNCTRDEGRSFEAGSQVLASNHCKLLSSKAMVVSVAVNVGRISRRVGVGEASASEPPMKWHFRARWGGSGPGVVPFAPVGVVFLRPPGRVPVQSLDTQALLV